MAEESDDISRTQSTESGDSGHADDSHGIGHWLGRLRENPQWVIYVLTAGILYYIASEVFRRFPHSGDEFAYMLQARTFLEGKIINPPPPFPPVYTPIHTITMPWGMFGKYPPGWPVFLAIGHTLSLSFLVNPVLGVLALVRGYRLVERLADRQTALIMIALMASSSFFLFNSASFYAHPLVLLALVLILDHLDRYRRNPATRDALIAACALGVIVLARPFDAVLILGLALPVLATYFFRNFSRPLVRDTALAIGVQLLAVALYLLYNKGTTGDFFTFGHQLVDPLDRPELDPVEMDRPFLFRAKRYLEVFVPVILVPFALLPKSADGTLSRRMAAALLAFSLLFWIGYATYLIPDLPPRHGPRYLYPTLFPLALLAATAIMRAFPPAARWVAVALICAGQLTQTAYASRSINLSIDAGTSIYQATNYLSAMVAPERLLVGMLGQSGSIPAIDLIRNDLDYEQEAIFIRTPLGLRPPAPASQDRLRYFFDGVGGAPVLWSDDPDASIAMFVLSVPSPTAIPKQDRQGWVLVTGSNHCYGQYRTYPGMREDYWARLGPCPGPSKVSWVPEPMIDAGESLRQQARRFYAHFRSFLHIEKGGLYRFEMDSTGGGAMVRVGNMIVVDDDPVTPGGKGNGKADLKPGIYPVSVSYYHLEGVPSMSFKAMGPEGEPIPRERFLTVPPGPTSFYGRPPKWLQATLPDQPVSSQPDSLDP